MRDALCGCRPRGISWAFRPPSPLFLACPLLSSTLAAPAHRASRPSPQTTGLGGRLNECCGETARPALDSVPGCITAIDAFNQDKSATRAGCKLPNPGPGATSKVCNNYSSAFSKSAASETCLRGFCASNEKTFGRRLRSHGNY
jgi:hypothetical protein